jgi:hypothetical protein
MTVATVWNPSDKNSGTHLTGGNLTATVPAGGDSGVRGTTSHSSGKWYLEYPVCVINGIRDTRGFAAATQSLSTSSRTAAFGVDDAGSSSPSGYTAGSVSGHNLQFAIDISAGLYWFRYDGGTWFGSTGSADPVAGTNGIDYTSEVAAGVAIFPWCVQMMWTFAGSTTMNPGSSAFANTAPSGFTAWDTVATPATPAITNTAGASFGGGTPGTVAYTTVGVDNIVVLHITSEPNHTSGSVAVSSVADTHSLTWTKKTDLHFLSASTPNTDNTQEIWWAHAPTALSGTITVTMAATIDDGTLTTVSVSGVYDPASPWDPNVSLPATATNTTGSATTPSATFSTTAASTLVLGFYGAPVNYAEISADNSLFLVVNQINSGGTNWSYNYVGEATYTSPQTSIAASFGASVARWGLIVLALDGSNPVVSPTGTMAVTEAHDTFAATGLTPDTGTMAETEAPDIFAAIGTVGYPGAWGYLACTEAKDIFAGVGNIPSLGVMIITEKPDIFSAYGYLPVKGTMTITEHHDIFAAVGSGWGVDGTWASTEAPDIFAAVGHAPVSGALNVTEAADRFQAIGYGVTQVRRRRNFFVT